jgi:hypothetical protein
MGITPRLVVVASAVAASAVGCQDLQRTDDFGEGELRVSVVDDGGAPVAGARVSVVGAPRIAVSDDAGLAVVRGLVPGDHALHIGVDDDGDGVFDRAAVRGDQGTIRVAEVRGLARRTAFVTAPIAVAATGEVAGSVAGLGADELARVVVVRTVTLGTGRTREVQLPVEAGSGVDVDGTFRVRGLAPGAVTLVAFAWPRPTSTEPAQQLIAASRPTRFAVLDVDVGRDDVAFDALAAVPPSGAVTLELAGELAEARNNGEAIFTVPLGGPDVAVSVVGAFSGVTASSPTVTIDAPVGVFDLSVQVNGIVGSVPLTVGLPDVAWLPVPVGLDPACLGEKPDEADPEDCGGDLDGDRILDEEDDDNDGDGVPDASEPTACRLAGAGADADGDCLCDAADPFPDCASNDPVDCTPAAPIVCD